MKQLNDILKIGEELIRGNDRNLNKLDSMIHDLLKGRDQKFFDSLDQKKLRNVVALHKISIPLNDIDRAYLDYVFHGKKPVKYFWKKISGKFSPEKFLKIKEIIFSKIDLDKIEKDKESWFEWIIRENIDWDDTRYENNEKDLKIEISISNCNGVPDIDIFISGKKKYANLAKKLEILVTVEKKTKAKKKE